MTATSIAGCSPASRPPSPQVNAPATQVATTRPSQENDLASWIGAYSSPSEIGGFSRTVLSLEAPFTPEEMRYRMSFYTDSILVGEIREKIKSGTPLIDGDCLYIPEASGFVHEGKTSLLASIARYTRLQIRGRTVLMRDDALREFREHNRLYDYGILIKVLDKTDFSLDLDTVKHESIKLLYQNATAPWADPFVHGPNQQ